MSVHEVFQVKHHLTSPEEICCLRHDPCNSKLCMISLTNASLDNTNKQAMKISGVIFGVSDLVKLLPYLIEPKTWIVQLFQDELPPLSLYSALFFCQDHKSFWKLKPSMSGWWCSKHYQEKIKYLLTLMFLSYGLNAGLISHTFSHDNQISKCGSNLHFASNYIWFLNLNFI